MDRAKKCLNIAAIIIATSLLGAGVASASPQDPPAHQAASTSAPGQPAQALGPPFPDHTAASTELFPHLDHREERLEDDEHQIINAAPHTLWRFDTETR
ncbi:MULTISPECIES: hypothetical protein [Micrococcaceae]|uniref:hypothetical protein n=1 Tax=Micrococcaceae TaxID=1268 RepID=UPI0011B01809|nr:hypothetical protein [Arthrobacter sp. N199823]